MIAAGTILAWQNQSFYNNTENEYVNFQYSDASGMSQRSANKDGNVFGNYDAEGAAVERDPLGGNVGIFTPYFQLNSGPPPQPESPMLQAYNPIDEMYVNGQRVPCMLDGVAIGCASARNMLENGSAIPAHLAPYQNDPDFRYEDRGLGIYTAHWTTSHTSPGWVGTEDDDGNVTWNWERNGVVNTVAHSAIINVSWSPQKQPKFFGINTQQKERINDTLTNLKDNKACTKAFNDAGVTTIAEQLEDGLNILGKLFVQNSNNDKQWVPKGGEDIVNGMREAYGGGFFGSKSNDVSLVGPWEPNGQRYLSLPNRAFDAIDDYFEVTLIHALIHSGGKEGRDRHFTGKYHPRSRKEGYGGGPIYSASTRGDLEWMGEKYNNIIKACFGKEPRVGWARGK